MKPNDRAIEAARKVVIQRATHNLFNPSFLFGVIEAALDAAYAAQFQSEEYAGLIRELRMRPHRRGYETEDEAKVRCQKEREASADAIEALLAERDDFAEQLALRSESGMAKDMQEIMRINNELVAERDALAARLAPVEDDALVEIVAVYCSPEMNWNEMSEKWKNSCRRDARAAIAAIRPHIEAVERERCAKIAEGSFYFDIETCLNSTKKEMTAHVAKAIAAAIRSGK